MLNGSKFAMEQDTTVMFNDSKAPPKKQGKQLEVMGKTIRWGNQVARRSTTGTVFQPARIYSSTNTLTRSLPASTATKPMYCWVHLRGIYVHTCVSANARSVVSWLWLPQEYICVHTEVKPYVRIDKCPICLRFFTDLSSLRTHVYWHFTVKKYCSSQRSVNETSANLRNSFFFIRILRLTFAKF